MSDHKESTEKGQIPEIEEEEILIFQFNDEMQEFQELEFEEDIPLYEILDSDYTLLFVDPHRYRVWIWHGANVTTRMKFISAKIAPKIRDKYGIAYKITTVDEGNETMAFKIMVGLEEEIDYETIQEGPSYEGTADDIELLKSLSREKILLLLEKAGLPEGYERKMVIVKNKIYGYKEKEKDYMGSVIKEKQLFPLKKEIEDGSYLADEYIPRMLFSFNNVILTELLKKINGSDKDSE
ncbi:MAG: hypothetical protein GF317_07535 [Candidatus Lokiarchaeota archaeon]|nr:hypothetical protein [Candidatus Lokiarchaeota archaeon]MBD3199561.1 hypothetical protein [Candidatus Lokiarchaeota archaeon]